MLPVHICTSCTIQYKYIERLLVFACLAHPHSEIRDLVSCLPSSSESRPFVCNFRFCLQSDSFQYDPKKDLACMRDKNKYSVHGPNSELVA